MREDRREKSGDGHTLQDRASNRRKSIFEVLQMDVFPVNWDSVPEVMNKEQFFRICHSSKSTALHLLKSGKVPCEWSGKKTRCYKIRKEDVEAYLEERAIFPEMCIRDSICAEERLTTALLFSTKPKTQAANR